MLYSSSEMAVSVKAMVSAISSVFDIKAFVK